MLNICSAIHCNVTIACFFKFCPDSQKLVYCVSALFLFKGKKFGFGPNTESRVLKLDFNESLMM